MGQPTVKRGILFDFSSRLQQKRREGTAEERSLPSTEHPAEPETGQLSHSIRPKVLTDKWVAFPEAKYPRLRRSPEETGIMGLFHKRALHHHQEVVRSISPAS